MGVSYEPVPAGELAAVVTFLEMRERPLPGSARSVLRLSKFDTPDVTAYRELFRRVGAPWLWFSRLIMDAKTLEVLIQDPNVELFAVKDERGRDVGMVELDFRQAGECELAFIGLIIEHSGKGHGKWLLEEVLRLSWRDDIRRVHVHTCSLDHPAALSAYRRAGFRPFKRSIERFPDPRLLGILPRECAPQIPIITA